MAVLSLGHLCVDLCQGALPALLPFLIAAHDWSYGRASALVLAAIGISLAGVAGSYGLTFAVVVVSGLGVAAYHPEASRFANYVAGARRATAMSLFSVGGNAGLALGPAIVTPLALAFGLSGTPLVAVLPLAVAGLLVAELARLVRFRPATATRSAAEETEPDQWRPFVRLTLAIAARSVVFFGLTTLVPLYFVGALHASEGTANTALTVMLACGAIGSLVGGRLADRFSRRIVLRVSLALLTPLILSLIHI